MKLNFNDYWAAEYSVSGAGFHIDLLSQILETNTRMATEGQNSDYQIFGIFQTSQEADVACDKMTEKQHKTRIENKQETRK